MILKTTYDSFIKIKAAHFRAAWRPVAESNRSKRFCRPLTKSLIQPAVARATAQYDSLLRNSYEFSPCSRSPQKLEIFGDPNPFILSFW